jgi:putative transposase
MKRSKFTEAQIAFILRQAEEGTAIGEVCRKAGISEATFYNWRKKYPGLMTSEMKRLRQLEDENSSSTHECMYCIRARSSLSNSVDRD